MFIKLQSCAAPGGKGQRLRYSLILLQGIALLLRYAFGPGLKLELAF